MNLRTMTQFIPMCPTLILEILHHIESIPAVSISLKISDTVTTYPSPVSTLHSQSKISPTRDMSTSRASNEDTYMLGRDYYASAR